VADADPVLSSSDACGVMGDRRGRADWLVGHSEMVELIRFHPWSQTALGPIEDWPESLQTTVSLCLASSFPIDVIWGPSYVQIWNEGYARICGEKHPAALGSDYRECWASAWPASGGAFDAACAGETAFLENQSMFLDRNGYLEETSFTFSLSPIRDDAGEIAGLFHPVTETTPRTLAERRTRVLRDLASRGTLAHTVADATARALDALKSAGADLPFVMLFLAEADGSLRLAGDCGAPVDTAGVPLAELMTGDGADSLLAAVMRDGRPRSVGDLRARFGAISAGPYPEPIARALLHPIAPPGAGRPIALLAMGMSSRLPVDETYLGFFDLVAAGVTNMLANATAHQQERERAEALAELDRAKTEFFSNVSHEFRTPLTLMLGPLEEALRDADNLDPRLVEQLTAAHRNSLRLQRLVNSLLDFSRAESGRVAASYRPTELSALTAEIVSQFESVTAEAGVSLVVDCEPLPEPVYVDRVMWEKIVLNLVSNAFKHTFDGVITVRMRRHEGDAVLSVSDTGIGISADELPRLFERFHRVKDARSRSVEGTGIGLALVRDLTRLHGGAVAVESEPGVGTTFTVSLPAGHAHLPADQIDDDDPQLAGVSTAGAHVDEARGWLDDGDDLAGEPTGHPATRARVLIADDNADMRAHLRRLLAPRFAVTAVGDGRAALQAALADPPDVVLTDVMMPHLDGFGLLRGLRDDDRTRLVPVIMLSARAGEQAGIEGIDAGVDDYLVKPFSARELIARITRCVELAQLRRQTERAAEARTVQTLESMSDAFYTLDPDTRFTYINAEGERLLARPREQLLGRRLLDVFPEAGTQPLWLAELRALREQVTVVLEERFEPLDKWLSARLYPSPDGLAVYLQDVTEHKQLQEQLLQSQKLEAVGQLASGVAHDFNNVLTIIEGYGALAQAKLELDPAFVATALTEIRNASASAAALTAKLLAFSRREPMHPTLAEVNEIVSRALDLVAPLIGEDIVVHRDLAPEQMPVRVDITQIEQVIVNLAVNARDAMPDGGELRVTTRSTGLESRSGSERAQIAITDTGAGIDEHILARIFDPFFTTKPVGKGTGLGLSTALATIGQAGGRLGATSTPGRGTTFTITLPMIARAAGVTGAGRAQGDDPTRILLVEDDHTLRRLLGRTLRSEGYEVIEADDADNAADLIASVYFDLMVTDNVLPGADRRPPALAAAAHQPQMPILHMSGAPQPPDTATDGEHGTGFLLKPFGADELASEVRELLARDHRSSRQSRSS
jgi:PAS domain S-box-containing protein